MSSSDLTRLSDLQSLIDSNLEGKEMNIYTSLQEDFMQLSIRCYCRGMKSPYEIRIETSFEDNYFEVSTKYVTQVLKTEEILVYLQGITMTIYHFYMEFFSYYGQFFEF